MKKIAIPLVFAAFIQPAWALFPLLDHIDVKVTYRASSKDWLWQWVTAEESVDPSAAYFPARDAEYPDGEKDYRPAGTAWDFLGVREGEPLWIYSESSSAYSWLGFGDTTSGLQDPVSFKLVNVLGPAGGHFALYRVISGSPVVFMSTRDGIGAGDVYAKPAGHHHVNWSFGKPGMWAVDLKVSALRTGGNGSTATGPTDTRRMFFAIGKKAEWLARNFDATGVMDESIAGDLADPDHDGWPNLLEYAFGGNPRQNGLKRGSVQAAPTQGTVVHSGNRHASITFFRMRNPETTGIRYAVQWQSDLNQSRWSEGGTIHQIENVDASWERVTVRDELPGEGRRFARIRVESVR
jgi:surface-anchored protein